MRKIESYNKLKKISSVFEGFDPESMNSLIATWAELRDINNEAKTMEVLIKDKLLKMMKEFGWDRYYDKLSNNTIFINPLYSQGRVIMEDVEIITADGRKKIEESSKRK